MNSSVARFLLGLFLVMSFGGLARAQTSPKIEPTHKNFSYGPHERNVLDFWKADSTKPTPFVIHIHGGGFAGGSKGDFRETTLREFLNAGISVVSVNYRYYQQAGLPAALHDCRRALQFVRSKATEWNLDKSRSGAFGGSAGAITSMYLAFHDEMANPASNDPIEHESTRLLCVATTAGQTTLDTAWWSKSVPGWSKTEGVKDDIHAYRRWGCSEADFPALIADGSALHLISKDDPPIWMGYSMRPDDSIPASPKEALNWKIHHVAFGVALKEKMDALGLESHLNYPGLKDASYASLPAFLIAKLQESPKRGGAASFSNPADLPAQPSLPDPLVMFNGRKVTTREMWMKERRPELIRLFQHYMTGQLPPKPGNMTAEVIHADSHAFDGKATLREVRLIFSSPEVSPIYLLLVVPNNRTRPAPVVLGINYFGNHTLVHDPKVRRHDLWAPAYGKGVVDNKVTEEMRGSWADTWRIEEVIARGYAVASFYNGDVDPDRPDERGLQRYFPTTDPVDACGTIGAWAWGLMRAVDYLVAAPEIDAKRIVVTGHSRMGKAALFAAAFDERIALANPHQAGTGGSAPSRTEIKPAEPLNTTAPKWGLKPNETIANLNEKLPHFFNARFREFSSQPGRLPFDQHCLVALCAPRPVLFTNGRADTWINPAGQFSVLEAAAPVYRLLGESDFTLKAFPQDGELAVSGKLGYFLRPGYHSIQREDWKVFLDFADKHLGRP